MSRYTVHTPKCLPSGGVPGSSYVLISANDEDTDGFTRLSTLGQERPHMMLLTCLLFFGTIVSLHVLRTEASKCVCAKFRTPIFVVSADDVEDDDVPQDYLEFGQCVERRVHQRPFWEEVTYNGQHAFVQKHEVMPISCSNASVSYSPVVMDALFNCPDWTHRVRVMTSSYLPSNEFSDEKDMPLSSLQTFLEGDDIFVSLYMDEEVGVPYGRSVCIPELNQENKRMIPFRVANVYQRDMLSEDNDVLRMVFDGGVHRKRDLTMVFQ